MNKKLSQRPKKTFNRIMEKGHKKVGYKPSSGKLLMQFSEEDHKLIAALIARWLEEKSTNKN